MKNLVAVLFVLLSLHAFSQIPNYVPTDGLVAWYDMDGNLSDSSPHGLDGTATNLSSATDRYGVDGGCLSFSGSVVPNTNRTQIANDAFGELPISDAFEDGMTISIWALEASTSDSEFLQRRNNNSIDFTLGRNDDGGIATHMGFEAFAGPGEAGLDSWHHYALTYDEETIKLYIDGVLSNSRSANQNVNGFANWVGLGKYTYYGGLTHFFFFNGLMDELGFWNRSLSPEEIEALFQSQENAGVDGCTDETACNYNPEATEDDGSCIIANIVVDDSQLCETGVVAMSVFQNVLDGEPRSLSFSQGQYVRIPMSPSLSNFTDYTMEFWYYETGGHGSDEMIVGTEFFSGNRYGIYSFVDGYWPYIRDNSTFLGLGYNGSNPNAGISYNMNEWNHIAITYDGSTFRFFVNGQLSYSESGTVSGFGPLTEDLVINRHTWNSGSSSRLAGQLDELRISDIARYTSDFSPPEYEFQNDLNTKGLWHFNEGRGTTVYDASTFGNHGNCLGTEWSENTPITQSLTGGYDVFWNGGEESTPSYDASPGETVEVVLVGELGSCSEVINISAYDLDEGCADEDACNYSETAACNLGCVYPVLGASDCDEGSLTCGPGTVWDADNQTCVVAIPAYLNEPGEAAVLNPCYFDSNGNGLVEVTDLMNVLSVYGMECGDIPAAAFSCGDPLNYQGYDYATIQISDQCWFAENLRTENYQNGDAIDSGVDASIWSSVNSGLFTPAYGDQEDVEIWGMLYNGYAVLDSRKLCPSGWHIGSDDDFLALESHLGLDEGLNDYSYRGTSINLGGMFKEVGIIDDGTGFWYSPNTGANNSSGLSMRANGWRSPQGEYEAGGAPYGTDGNFWTSTFVADAQFENEPDGGLIRRRCDHNSNGVKRDSHGMSCGFGVRCIQD